MTTMGNTQIQKRQKAIVLGSHATNDFVDHSEFEQCVVSHKPQLRSRELLHSWYDPRWIAEPETRPACVVTNRIEIK